MKYQIRKYKMDEIYNKLSKSCYKKTIKLELYNEYIKIIRQNWKQIFDFYSTNNIQKYELDTYINKKKAIHKIVRKIVPKKNKSPKFKEKDKLICDLNKYEEIKKRPIMIAFGKGNGNTTIDNIKNSGPKGPIKTIAKELSHKCMTILIDEYNTSQVCPICQEQKVKHKKEIKEVKVKGKKENVKKMTVESYRLCYCENNKKHPLNMDNHEIWLNRDYIGSLNIINKLKIYLTKTEIGMFQKEKLDKPMEVSWSQDRQGSDKGFPRKKKNKLTKENQSSNKSEEFDISELVKVSKPKSTKTTK